jgi:hypothetical protein
MAEFRLSNFTSGSALTAAELNTGLTYGTYTPTWTQGVTIDRVVDWARFTKFGKFVNASIKLTSTSVGVGTSGSVVTIALPEPANSNNFILGQAHFSMPNFNQARYALYNTSTTMRFSTSLGTVVDVNSSMTNQVLANSVVYVQITYEAA